LRAYERVFRDLGLDFPDVARDAVLSGMARLQVLDLALPAAEADLKRRLSDAKPEALRTVLRNQADCSIPGATETVRALAQAGVPMAVVTNSRSPEIWMEKIGITNQIQVVVTGDDVSSPKPSALRSLALRSRTLTTAGRPPRAQECELRFWPTSDQTGSIPRPF
jgi:beta-phosphoglucomutase-like phosphatase (HAD superfamily)